MDLKPGDVVELKSGGPDMTIETVGHDGRVACVWFDGNQEKRALFQSTSLKKKGG
jgi:uncharacterized protein YodC (DUF2158 family)